MIENLPPANPDLEEAPTRSVRINGRDMLEMDAGKWAEFYRLTEYCAAGMPLKDKK